MKGSNTPPEVNRLEASIMINDTSGAAMKHDRIALLVLGMHRSGTSALSGVLARLGCDIPATQIGVDAQNPKGFYESRLIARLNDAVLQSAGTTWADWSAFPQSWFESPRHAEFSNRAVELLTQEFCGSSLIVLKDPRICRLTPFWLNALNRAGYKPQIVHVHRNPVDVAQSLNKRNDFDLAFGHLLWLRHIIEAEHGSRNVTRVFVGYDRLMKNWSQEISRLQTTLGLVLPRSSPDAAVEVDDFLDPSLQHFVDGTVKLTADPLLPDWSREILRILDRWAITGEDAADYIALDQTRAELDRMVPAFIRLVRAAEDRRQSNYVLRDKLAMAEADVAGAKEILHLTKTELKAQSEQHATDLEDKLQRAETDLQDHERRNKILEAELASLRGKLSQRGTLLLEAESKIQTLNHEMASMAKLQIELQTTINATADILRAQEDLRRQEAKKLDMLPKQENLRRQESEKAQAFKVLNAQTGKKYRNLGVLRFLKDRRALKYSQFFDGDWYLTQNSDVRVAGLDPARHYLLYGCDEGRDPGPNFNTVNYYYHNPDVLLIGVNAAIHYIRYGHAENRQI